MDTGTTTETREAPDLAGHSAGNPAGDRPPDAPPAPSPAANPAARPEAEPSAAPIAGWRRAFGRRRLQAGAVRALLRRHRRDDDDDPPPCPAVAGLPVPAAGFGAAV
ncbi:hypothetical protein [Lichenibacterium ramalinae]|uniref:Uncharacterized protein n=1 Tax=Lichenibacterium ramalinae TaxID=2316527 RepID=A0A4Q2RHC6_9HYPH|nr:hypothetical protein [Lichenibacterium ramalinae]RYB07082.1 hypothetical protein D3272_03115 [Lichenibacterium ramalinae]